MFLESLDSALPVNKRCKQIMSICLDKLRALAYKGIYEERLRYDEFIVLCVDVHDPHWKAIADEMSQYKDYGINEDPKTTFVIYKNMDFSFCKEVCLFTTGKVDILIEKPPEGYVKVIILSDGVAQVGYIFPIPGKDSLAMN